MSEIDNAATTVTVADTGATVPDAATDATASAPVTTGETPADTPPEPDKGKTDAGLQKAINRLTRQRGEAERRAMRLEAELEVARRSTQPAPTKSADLRPQDFPNYDAYVEAKIDAKTEEKFGALTRGSSEQADQQAQKTVLAAFVERATEQSEAAGIDFDAVMETLQEAPLLSRTVVAHLAESNHTARLAEYLAENPGELDRVSRLGPALAKKSLAAMEAKFGTPSRPNDTKAPPPVPPVGGRSVTQADPSKMSMDEYAAHWAKRQEALHG